MSTQVITEVVEEIALKEPSKYRVILHNDDKTTFDFVIHILTEVFHKELNEATEITFRVHDAGAATAGVYTHQIAECKIGEAAALAKANNFPLKLTAEEF